MMIERYTHWNEDIGEWQLKCVAYTGNNMRKHISENKSSANEVRTLLILEINFKKYVRWLNAVIILHDMKSSRQKLQTILVRSNSPIPNRVSI